MALNTNTYGYVIDPLFSFCDQGGKTIANGYVRVFRAGTSTPVLTYRNYDGAFNAETIELDNSGRTMTQVIASKGDLYKVCVYDAEHSQEDPILTVDKVAVIGSSVNATNIVQGLNDVAGSGWIKSVAADDTAEISLVATNVTSEVDTMVKATAASADYMVPLVHKAGSDPDKKITLGNIFKFVLNFIHSLTDTATESDLVSGNYFALDGSEGTKKLPAEIFGNMEKNSAHVFDATRTNANPYAIGEFVMYNGSLYRFIASHYGAWNASHVIGGTYDDLKNLEQGLSFSIIGENLTVKNKYVFLPKGVDYIGIKATPNPWSTDTIGGTNPNILIVYAVASDGTETTKAQYSISQVVPEVLNISVPSTAVMLRFFIRANYGASVSFDVYNNVQKQIADIEQNISDVESSVANLGDSVDDLKVVQFGSEVSIVGKGMTAVQSSEYEVVGLSTITLDFSSNGSWPVTQLTSGANKFMLQGYYNNQWNDIVSVPKTSSAMKFISDIPINCKKVRFFVRCDTGTTLQCHITSVDVATSFTVTGRGQSQIHKYIKVKPDTEYCLFADRSWSIAGISSSSGILNIYQVNESLQQGTVLVQTQAPSIPSTEYRFVTPSDCTIIEVFFRGASSEVVNFNLSANFYSFIDFDKYRNLESLRHFNGYQLPSLLLMGDPHSDSNSYNNYLKLANNRYNAINAIVVLGDMARDYPVEAGTYENYDAFVAASSSTILPVIGNHDIGSGYGIDHYCPLSDVVSKIMAGAESRGFIPSAPKGYYYLDIGTAWNYKTRVIVLNNYNIPGTYDPDSKWEQVAYDSSAPSIAFSTSYNAGDVVNVGVWTDYSYRAKENVTTPASSPTSLVHTFPCWSVRPDAAKIDAEQAQWVLDTMASTPNYTGIVIVQHSTLATSCKKDFSSKFTQQGNVAMEVSGIGDFLVSAAKAFEDKNASFSYTVQGESVSKDFSGRTSTSSFVGFLGGHQHHDFIIRSTTYPKYYEVSANKAMSSYAGDNSDIFVPPSMPSATYVTVNRETKSMGLTKIGVDYTQDGYRRDIDLIKQETPANWS